MTAAPSDQLLRKTGSLLAMPPCKPFFPTSHFFYFAGDPPWAPRSMYHRCPPPPPPPGCLPVVVYLSALASPSFLPSRSEERPPAAHGSRGTRPTDRATERVGFNDMMKEEEGEEEKSRGRELGRLVLPTYVRPL